MTVDKDLSGGCLTLKVAGRLDTNTAAELESEFSPDGVSEIVFDFAGLEYISSAGLRVLMMVMKAMSERGGKVRIANPNMMVKGVLDMTGLSSVFAVDSP